MKTKLVENSSQINEIGYDEQKLIFQVVYKNGAKYHYLEVPKEIWEQAQTAESMGKYVAAHIKSVYQFKKVG